MPSCSQMFPPPTILDITLTHLTINIHILTTYLILTSLWDKLNWSSDPSVADSMKMRRRFMALPCNFASQPLGKLIRLEAGKWSWKVTRSDHQTSSMNFVGRGTWKTVHDKVWMYESSIGKKKSTSPSPTLLEKLLSSCWNSGGFREDPKKEQRGFSEWHQGRGLPIFGGKMHQVGKGKPKISHWTLRSPTRLDPGEFEDKMPYELPSEWVNAWVNSSETYPKAEFDFLWEPLRVTPRHQIPGPAHPYLGRALAIFHLGIFRHPGLSWSIFGPPRLSLHAFFFLLCRWKAVLGDGFGEGWMGFPWFAGPEIKWRQHAIASSCSQDTAWTVNCWQPL